VTVFIALAVLVALVLLYRLVAAVRRVARNLALLSLALGKLLGDGSHLDKLVRQTRDIADAAQEVTK
jgi:hypothetical protein